MAKKTTTETPPSMLGIMRYNIDTSAIRVPPEAILAVVVGFILLELLLQI